MAVADFPVAGRVWMQLGVMGQPKTPALKKGLESIAGQLPSQALLVKHDKSL